MIFFGSCVARFWRNLGFSEEKQTTFGRERVNLIHFINAAISGFIEWKEPGGRETE